MNAAEAAYVEELRSQLVARDGRIKGLEEALEWLRKQVFGKRSERVVEDVNQEQLYFAGLEPATEQEATTPISGHKRKKKRNSDRIAIPEDLPVETVVQDLPEEEKVVNGIPLVKIGEEVTYKLCRRPGSFFIREIIRPKYGLPEGEGVRIAELPDSILPRCVADESLLADLLVRKFADHLPLYRISESWGRERVQISRQLLSQWVLGLGDALEPLYQVMHQKILESENVFIDETWVGQQAPQKMHRAYMWVIAGGNGRSPPYCVYHFRPRRNHEYALELLKDFSGVFHSDKYGAYVKLADTATWCPCWAHIRRKFVEALEDREFCSYVVRKIRHLYLYERVAWSRSPEERLRIRQEKEGPLIDELIERLKKRYQQGDLLPKSRLAQALKYVFGLEPHLKNYLKHAEAQLDNNVAERAMRPLAIGRKNWLFVGSPRGGRAASVIYSLVQTCRNLGIDPYEYLEDMMRRLPSHPACHVEELLPDHWAAVRRETQSQEIHLTDHKKQRHSRSP